MTKMERMGQKNRPHSPHCEDERGRRYSLLRSTGQRCNYGVETAQASTFHSGADGNGSKPFTLLPAA
jgi:hypothetical protein